MSASPEDYGEVTVAFKTVPHKDIRGRYIFRTVEGQDSILVFVFKRDILLFDMVIDYINLKEKDKRRTILYSDLVRLSDSKGTKEG